MGVGLQPLEFTECLADSPVFRENLLRHEKELERTSQQIKRLIKEVKDVVNAAKRLGAAQLALAESMRQIEFTCIGASMTEDERVISHSLHHFADLIRTIEDERDRMLGRANEQIIQPLEKFRKEHIGAVKEGKKKFDKKTAKFCQSQERTLSLSTKKPETVFKEADAAMDMAERDLSQASVEYAFQLQSVQERKKFELVETLLGFVFGWWTFYHTAHDVHADSEPRVRDLQLRIQRTRSNFEETSSSLMKKMKEVRQMSKEGESNEDSTSRSGYLFLMEKKAFGTTWTKQYCTYDRATRTLTLTPYNQLNVKSTGGVETLEVVMARAVSEPVERRWCWEAAGEGRALVLQALSAAGAAAWARALCRQPAPLHAPPLQRGDEEVECMLDEAGFAFVRSLITTIEARGLEEQGLYRVAGVASKVARLVSLGGAALRDPAEWETKTLTSALKAYLRALPEPLLTRARHKAFIAAAKRENRSERVREVAVLVRGLPRPHRDMLRLVLLHLRNVMAKSDRNLMTCSNLAVVFGPTLVRASCDTVAAILDLKFCNVLVETLLEHYHDILAEDDDPTRASPNSIPVSSRNDISVTPALMSGCARYSPQHQQLLQHFPPHAGPAPPPHPMNPAYSAVPPQRQPRLLAALGRSSSSSAESVSSCGASPPRPAPSPHRPLPPRYTRVRTLYACLGESEGELSFEPNQIITNVSASPEPGWLRGTLNGKTGLVPHNYVEPLP